MDARAGEGVFEVEIERILPGGMGLAHAEGRTLLVALAAPGDRVRVRVERKRGSLAFASILEVIEPSTVRVEPPCPYFGRCGGCDFQQLTYEAQLQSKVEIIRDCLRRIAQVEPPADLPITPAPNIWRYRSRAQWQHDAVRSRLGYFERGSHRVCDVVECPVVIPPLQEKLSSLREAMRADALPEDAQEFQAAAGDAGVALWPPLDEDADERENVRIIGGERYRFDATCFFQINHDLLEPLIRHATDIDGTIDATDTDAAETSKGDTALDLYCGVGLFTLPLARRFKRVVGVEAHPAACRFARLNLAEAGLTNASIETSPVGQWLTHFAARQTPPPLYFLLLDPPRAGAEPEALQAILRLRPRRISYVSCDPATLARDLRQLLQHRYQINSIQAFDLFPQTHHVETVVRLTLLIS
jgi:tRNA/tmRNA/rRNA uracil-C5-methylase (TrmA/RlmC/RlmD family)